MASWRLGPILQEVISHPVCVCVCVCVCTSYQCGNLTNLDMCTVIVGFLSHPENKILTDQSNASNSSTSLGMANLIGQFFIFPRWRINLELTVPVVLHVT